MGQNSFVQFKKERDLGAIITDTFTFIRNEWKPFFTTIFKVSIIPILIAIGSIIFLMLSFSEMFDNALMLDVNRSVEPDINYGAFFLSMLVFVLCYLVAYVMVTIAAMYYIKSYVDNAGTIDYAYIRDQTRAKFWPLLGLFIISGIIIVAGAFLCFFPAIYLGVVLSLASSIYIFQEKGVWDTINDAFVFIKGHWWETFGVLLVVGLMVGVMNYITQIPALIYQLFKTFSMVENNDPTVMASLFKDPIYLLLLGFSYVIRFFLYTISLITTVFIYFDINEKKNASGSIDIIDSIGS